MHGVADIESLHSLIQTGVAVDYLTFWGHTPRAPGSIDRSCLSQWYPAPFEIEGTHYATAEHYMMAEKARLFGDTQMARQIVEAPTPALAKKLGRAVAGYADKTWTTARFAIVVRGNQAKFAQNPACKAFLLSTANTVLVEASPVDPVWGIGLAADEPAARVPSEWQGLNLLGFALMQVRARLLEA